MNWLNVIVDDLLVRHPEGEILIESGGSPSGTYHLGHLRELVTCDAIMLELQRRGRQARHIYFSDDLDALRKIPVNVPAEFEKYLGYPLCDVPAPDGIKGTYGAYFLEGLKQACQTLGIEVEFINSHEKYRSGFFVPAIERVLERVPAARHALETVAGRQLDDHWTPIQVMEQGRLKNRRLLSLDKDKKLIHYEDAEGKEQEVAYNTGQVKLDWRLDWPGRWWLLGVHVEPFGRDHASAGGSFATGVQIMKEVYEAEPPMPVPYDFINMVGDTKKMSASKGTGLDAVEGSQIMPAEVLRYFILRAAPSKRLYFDPVTGVMQLMDEFAALAAKPDRSEAEEQLLYICTHGQNQNTVSRIPFSHLVASYQAALRDISKTLEVLRRTEYAKTVDEDEAIIRQELRFIDEWLNRRAPEDVKFSLVDAVTKTFNEAQKDYFRSLAEKIEHAPQDADGSWFHQAIYEFKDKSELEPKELFTSLYQLLIGKDSGPRAGWFLSILPRDWLVKRLRLEA